MDHVLDAIAALYEVEQQIRNHALTGQAKRTLRQEQSKPALDLFFASIDGQFDKQGILPSSLFLAAQAYIRERRVGLYFIWTTPARRPTPITWNVPFGQFGWAKKLVVQLDGTGRKAYWHRAMPAGHLPAHGIKPYGYFVSVLQRVVQHSASLLHQRPPHMSARFA